MGIKLYGKKVTTVWLSEGGKNLDNLKMFYCPNCRTPVVQYQGDVITLVPGNAPYTPRTIIKCRGDHKVGDKWIKCNMYYSFADVVRSE